MKLPEGKAPEKVNKPFKLIYNKGTLVKANPYIPGAMLGKYYLDLTPTLIDYSEYRYGEFDQSGVPMVGWGKDAYYLPVNIAQFGFIIHDLWLESKNPNYLERLKKLLEWFDSKKEDFKGTYVWYNLKYDKKYDLKAPWVSGMAIGEIISFYVRMSQVLNKPSLIETALKAFDYLKLDVSNGGVRRYDINGNLWFEEYPTEKPSFVLNGFIYTIFGLFDLYRVSGNERVKDDLEKCIKTLKESMHLYDVGYWSLYDQLKKELVMVYYQRNVHVPELDALFQLTDEPIFKYYRDKWLKTLAKRNILFVKIMYRVKPRLDKFLELFRKD